MNVRGCSLTFAALLLLAVPARAQAPSEPIGVWIDHTGRGAVEITSCGDALCGRVVWLKDAANTKACGVQILGEVKPAGRGVWGKGWIYDPEEDSKFDVELKPVGTDKLRVVGYLGTKLFSETMMWQRAPADLKRCDATEQTAAATPTPSEAAPTAPEAADQKPTAPAPSAAAPPPPSTGEPKVAEQTPAPSQQASPPTAEKAPDQRPRRQAQAQSEKCKVELPWFSVSFPCPD